MTDDRITTIDGLNGMGGKRVDIVCIQDELAYAPGQEFTLLVKVPAGIGKARFLKSQRLLTLAPATLVAVTSDSLHVTEDDQAFTIDITRTEAAKESHSMVLRIKAPRTEPPPMLTISGRITTPQGGGFSITRGIPLELPASDVNKGKSQEK